MTTPLRTALDLGRVRHPDRAIAGMDTVVHHGGVTKSELLAEVERFAAEHDGAAFHSSPEQVRHDRDRRSGLREEHDWLITVTRRDDLFGPHQDVEAQLQQGWRAALRRAGRRLDLPAPGPSADSGVLWRD